ncbi:MAG: hypothetical protein ACR2MS_03580 [Weeksellaceae bacterium]
MKNFKLLVAIFVMSFVLFSCNDDDENPVIEKDPVTELGIKLIHSIENAGHTIELYGDNEDFHTGYNNVYIRIKNAENEYEEDFKVTSWFPQMHMINHTHACPFSEVMDTDYKTLKKGYMVFLMPSNDKEYWDMALDYNLNGQAYSVTGEKVTVKMNGTRKNMSMFTGTDTNKYIIAYVNPTNPKVAVNDTEILVFKKASMMSFPLVKNYTVALDPRMPSMGNHSSPNNEDYTYNAEKSIYEGKLSLTMTGYWKLNLKVMNEEGVVIGGTDVTDTNESSDVYVEIEF